MLTVLFVIISVVFAWASVRAFQDVYTDIWWGITRQELAGFCINLAGCILMPAGCMTFAWLAYLW